MPADPFAWLGLLKWSLSYSDGTAPSDSVQPMSAEDRAFLERVMKEGIIDENERMKTILKEVTNQMEVWKQSPNSYTRQEEENVQVLLEEVRDIVEQIDYARAFAAMKGLPFLIGCVQERQYMPRSTRLLCLGILSTMAQHNIPVQKELLEMGALKTLTELYFDEEMQDDDDGEFRARIIQSASATVRGYDLAESVFCQLDQAVALLEDGLGVGQVGRTPPVVLRKRTLFFLRAVVTSDNSTRDRVRLFSSCIAWVADSMIVDIDESSSSTEIREMALSFLVQVLEQKRSVDTILQRRDRIVATGIQRVSALRKLTTDQEREFAATELDSWEQLLLLLSRATPDDKGVLPQ